MPFESQVPRAPESFQDADLQADSGEQSPQQEAQASTDEGVRGEQHREPAAGDSGKEGPAQQQAASPETDAGKQVSPCCSGCHVPTCSRHAQSQHTCAIRPLVPYVRTKVELTAAGTGFTSNTRVLHRLDCTSSPRGGQSLGCAFIIVM